MSLQPNPCGRRGPITAVLRSAAAVDHRRYGGGVSNIQESDSSLFLGDSGIDRLAGIIRGFFDLGGMELSLNFLDPDTLRKAQEHPERYRYLMVRVFGLSAQFINLNRELQELVIKRALAASESGQ